MSQVEISADLRFSVQLPGRDPVCGTVRGSGNRLEVRLSDPASFAGRRDAAALRSFAAALAARDLTVVVRAGETTLLEVGRTRAPWWQRPLTRSPHLRVAGARGALTGLVGRARRSAAPTLPGADLLPPTTLFPLAPTFAGPRRGPGTTHDPRRGGSPRLVLTSANTRLPEGSRTVFPLRGDLVTIGSGPGADIRLPGLESVHAVVVHGTDDELVLHDRSGDRSTRVNGDPVGDGRILRTGTRVAVGQWTFAYRRAEYADHGRPYGGRVGGELGRQRRQPDPRFAGTVDAPMHRTGGS